ncbi:MAG: flagellar hook-basal body protein [Phenylobacterium sp.]
MNGAFYIGATGLSAQQRALDVVANNIANLNTPGYKRTQARFAELVAPQANPLDPSASVGQATSAMLGVSADMSPRDFTQGPLTLTGRPMDLAIDGTGFIELVGPAGQTLLWRGGSLQVNNDGYLAAANGMPLKAMISPPAGTTALTIGQDGKVQATVGGEADPRSVGQIDLVQVKDLMSLSALDGGLFQPANDRDVTDSVPGEEGAGVLRQGAMEASNVQLTDEMVSLLLMQRAYSANAQVVQAGDELMSIANSLRR